METMDQTFSNEVVIQLGPDSLKSLKQLNNSLSSLLGEEAALKSESKFMPGKAYFAE